MAFLIILSLRVDYLNMTPYALRQRVIAEAGLHEGIIYLSTSIWLEHYTQRSMESAAAFSALLMALEVSVTPATVSI